MNPYLNTGIRLKGTDIQSQLKQKFPQADAGDIKWILFETADYDQTNNRYYLNREKAFRWE